MQKNQKNERKSDVIKKYEQRWVKPTIIIALLFLIPIGLYGALKGPNIVRAMRNYDASFIEASAVNNRPDPERYYTNTPSKKTEPVITKESELPEKPYMVVFFLHHCPYCEAGHPYVEGRRQQFIEDYPEYEDKIVYMDVQKGYGNELVHEHNVQASSTLMLVTEDGETQFPYADLTENGIEQQEAQINEAFSTLETQLEE